MYKHPESFLTLDQLGTRYPGYFATHAFDRAWVDAEHEALSRCELFHQTLVQLRTGNASGGEIIPGWLRLQDALKLYEMAYFSEGDILELGSYHGLSTSIMSRAIVSSGRARRLVTVDLDPQCSAATRATMDTFPSGNLVDVVNGEAAAQMRALAAEGRRFGFAFIDHSHAYGPMLDACRELHTVMTPGAFCLFHDYNDPRNRDPDEPDYGVFQAVVESLDPASFQLYGVYGCAALYRYQPA